MKARVILRIRALTIVLTISLGSLWGGPSNAPRESLESQSKLVPNRI